LLVRVVRRCAETEAARAIGAVLAVAAVVVLAGLAFQGIATAADERAAMASRRFPPPWPFDEARDD
jgi:hypothetical protein